MPAVPFFSPYTSPAQNRAALRPAPHRDWGQEAACGTQRPPPVAPSPQLRLLGSPGRLIVRVEQGHVLDVVAAVLRGGHTHGSGQAEGRRRRHPASRLTRPRPQPRGEPEPTPTAPHGRGQRPGPPPGYRERCGRARPRGGPGGRRRPPLPSARPLPAAAWPRPLASARPRHVTASRQSPGRGRRGRACALRGGDAEGEVEGRKLWGGKGEAL